MSILLVSDVTLEQLGAIALVAVLVLVAAALLRRWGMYWGATPAERVMELSGDRFLAERHGNRTVMTRAVSIAAPPQTVWPWLAQLGRGAGFYSYDRLDNAGKTSAQHIISWVPPPQPGDAVAFGYLRHLEPGRELVWWLTGYRWLGATWRGMFQFHLKTEGPGSRLIVRASTEACGLAAWPALWYFQFVDSIMCRRMLLGLKQRAEQFAVRTEDPSHPESGERGQYQGPVAIYADGQRAGSSGEQEVERWRQSAIADGVLRAPLSDKLRA